MRRKVYRQPRWSSVGLLCVAFASHQISAQNLHVGIIGTDSSHSVEFTRLLNDSSADKRLHGAKVVAAFRGGNPKLALSRDRIERFSSELKDRWRIPFVERISDLCSSVDGLLLLSVDPSARVQEFEEAAKCHKPIFVDKPAAATLQDIDLMREIATAHQVSWFSASALRFLVPPQSKPVVSAEVWGPGALGTVEEGYPLDLSWYGIHSIEMLSTAMGPGMERIARVHTSDCDTLTAVWEDGRIGVVHLIRPNSPFRIAIFEKDNVAAPSIQTINLSYEPLVQAIVDFFSTTGNRNLDQQTMQTFAAMAAAQRSMHTNGALVPLSIKDLALR